MKRQELKNEIIAYLNNAGVFDLAAIEKCLKAIKDAAYETSELNEMDSKMRTYAKSAGVQGDFYYRISWYFSPPHYNAIKGFVKKLESIIEEEMDEAAKLEQAIDNEIKGIVDPLDDEYFDDLGCPDFAIVIYADNIEVRAYEPGVGDRLPKKGRKYIGCAGDIRWSFPLSSLDSLQSIGRPVVDARKL